MPPHVPVICARHLTKLAARLPLPKKQLGGTDVPPSTQMLERQANRLVYRGGPLPGRFARVSGRDYQGVQRAAPSGQPPPRSQVVDYYSAGPPPFFGEPIVTGGHEAVAGPGPYLRLMQGPPQGGEGSVQAGANPMRTFVPAPTTAGPRRAVRRHLVGRRTRELPPRFALRR